MLYQSRCLMFLKINRSSQCGLHSSLFDYDEHAHSTPNSEDETASQEIYAGAARASSVLDTSIVVGISTSLQGCEEEEKEAGAGQ
jgi:hypothetical protein